MVVIDVWSALYFQDKDGARKYLESKLWPTGPICPRCGAAGDRVGKLGGKAARASRYKCYRCRKPFTLTVGTPFEATHVDLHHWFQAICLLAAPGSKIS